MFALYFLECLLFAVVVSGHVLYDVSTIELQSHAPRSRVMHGERLVFEYHVQLNVTKDQHQMNILINGSYLEVQNVSSLHDTRFVWRDTKDGIIDDTVDPIGQSQETGQMPEVVKEVTMVVPLSRDPSYILDSFTGKIEMFVSEKAPLGFLLRPFMYIAFDASIGQASTAIVIGDYVFTEIPIMDVSAGSPNNIDMKEQTTVVTKLVLPAGPLSSTILKVYMPNNVTASNEGADKTMYIEEPFMSAIDFEFTGSIGLDQKTIHDLTNIAVYYISNSRTSEIDELSVQLPQVTVKQLTKETIDAYEREKNNEASVADANVADENIMARAAGQNDDTSITGANIVKEKTVSELGEIRFETQAEMLDFVGATEGVEPMIGYALEVGDSFFIVQHTTVTLAQKHDKKGVPILITDCDVEGRIEDESETMLKLTLGVRHSPDSWGSAYNITWLWYFPPFVTGFAVGKMSDGIRAGRRTFKKRNNDILEFELQRMSFVHNVRVPVNVTFDMQHPYLVKGDEFNIVSEVIYNTKRGEQQELNELQSHFVQIGTKEKLREKLCQCSDDRLAECACSDDNKCNRKSPNVVCVDCNTPWLCLKTLPEYHSVPSSVTDVDGNIYTCAAPERNRKSWEIMPCLKRDSTNKIMKDMAPTLGIVLGTQVDSSGEEIIYGVSRNGLAYMISKDGGDTWYSVYNVTSGRV